MLRFDCGCYAEYEEHTEGYVVTICCDKHFEMTNFWPD